MSTALLPDLSPSCADPQRRADILGHPQLNGIDYIEYERRPGPPPQQVLVVHFIKPLPDPPFSNPDGAYGLTARPDCARVVGGSRIVGIEVESVQQVGDHVELFVSAEGDYSIYWLLLGWMRSPDGRWVPVVPNLDPRLSVVPVNFKAGCPADIDCRPTDECPPTWIPEPLIDYLAKDYASFRQLLLDLIPQLNPSWIERLPADLGISLVELLAYEGDQLSYFQDAVANETYLDTARQRVSAKRHARLVDYRMHDGRNAWTFVHFEVGSGGAIAVGTKLLTRVTAPLRNQLKPPGPEIAAAQAPNADAFEADPALAGVRAFETAFPLTVHPENNLIHLHTWGELHCCLPPGSRVAHLFALVPAAGPAQQAIRPILAAGDFLLLEEIKGPTTGAGPDADPAHRQVVQLVDVADAVDPAYSDQLTGGRLQVWSAGDTPLPLLRVAWQVVDGEPFPLCLSARDQRGDPIVDVSVARGNLVAADHGLTVVEQPPITAPLESPPGFRLSLAHGPVTLQALPAGSGYAETTEPLVTTARTALDGTAREASPAVRLRIDFTASAGQLWEPARDLLASGPFDQRFVVDIGNDGEAALRFGDDEYGRSIAGALAIEAIYRVGNGRAGNIGAESLYHVVRPATLLNWPGIVAIRNPLPAHAGADPETIEQTRQAAPAAFRAEQFRAVTEQDYADAARRMPGIAGAAAAFRWTGSWYTVYLGIDPSDPDDVLTFTGGRTQLAPAFEERVRVFVNRYRLAGYDLEIRAAHYVPLQVAIDLCICPSHFRSDVAQAVRRALGSQVNSDGSLGFFHPSSLGFGQPVYLSRLYAAVEAVTGVDSLVVTDFRRFGGEANGELARGVLPIGPWEIARLDNDPNFVERGVLTIRALGGK
jgi:hypothetical protein